MAINPENYTNLSFKEILGIQKVFIDDYKEMKDELVELDGKLSAAVEIYKSGQTASLPALKKVKKLVGEKVELKLRAERVFDDISAFDRILDERDGTISTARVAG